VEHKPKLMAVNYEDQETAAEGTVERGRDLPAVTYISRTFTG
jgi:hypothetical protein